MFNDIKTIEIDFQEHAVFVFFHDNNDKDIV